MLDPIRTKRSSVGNPVEGVAPFCCADGAGRLPSGFGSRLVEMSCSCICIVLRSVARVPVIGLGPYNSALLVTVATSHEVPARFRVRYRDPGSDFPPESWWRTKLFQAFGVTCRRELLRATHGM